MPHPQIVVAAVVLWDTSGRLLTVRKRGTSRFMLPGGKPEPGEAPVDTVVRECREETGLTLTEADLELLGEFRSTAANEPGHVLISTVFVHDRPVDGVRATAEIAEVRWQDVSGDLPTDLAPMLLERVVPALRDAGLTRT